MSGEKDGGVDRCGTIKFNFYLNVYNTALIVVHI